MVGWRRTPRVEFLMNRLSAAQEDWSGCANPLPLPVLPFMQIATADLSCSASAAMRPTDIAVSEYKARTSLLLSFTTRRHLLTGMLNLLQISLLGNLFLLSLHAVAACPSALYSRAPPVCAVGVGAGSV